MLNFDLLNIYTVQSPVLLRVNKEETRKNKTPGLNKCWKNEIRNKNSHNMNHSEKYDFLHIKTLTTASNQKHLLTSNI